VSSNKVDFDLREITPLSRNILHTLEVTNRVYGIANESKDSIHFQGHRVRLIPNTGTKGSNRQPEIPCKHSGFRRERHRSTDNHHLNYLVESISMNVGDSHQNVKASSLPMSDVRVGGVIVVRAWESHAHGEGHQFVGIPMQKVTEC
jgi:hypothetical protein